MSQFQTLSRRKRREGQGEGGALNRQGSHLGSVCGAFPSARPSPHSYVAGRGGRHSVKAALSVLWSILPTAQCLWGQDRRVQKITFGLLCCLTIVCRPIPRAQAGEAWRPASGYRCRELSVNSHG